MKKMLIGIFAFVALDVGGFAHAADLPVAMPVKGPMIAPAFSWTGFYLGIHGGYASVRVAEDPVQVGQFGPPQPKGGFGGAQLGYNYQFAPNWLVGIEVDGARGAIKDTLIGPDPLAPATLLSTVLTVDALATARARFGYVWDRFLIYGTGGLAWTRLKGTDATSNAGGLPFIRMFGADYVGWAAGGGIEAMLAGNWTAKAEYLYLDPGHQKLTGPGGPDIVLTAHTAKVGLNYKFDWSRPVIARY